MKIEKLNENRIQIIFNDSFLKENNIDVHAFMSNSIESQGLFLQLLDIAQNEIGFITDNYKLSIEAIALTNGTFIITVTRVGKEDLKSVHVHAKRKDVINNLHSQVYKFKNFDDFCNFENFVSNSNKISNLYSSKQNFLYKYNNAFYLVFEEFDTNYIFEISNIISEFGNLVQNSDMAIHKIKECGLLVRE